MKNGKMKLVVKKPLYIIKKFVNFIYNVFAFFGGFWFVLLFLCLRDTSGEMIAVSDLTYVCGMLGGCAVCMALITTVITEIINKDCYSISEIRMISKERNIEAVGRKNKGTSGEKIKQQD